MSDTWTSTILTLAFILLFCAFVTVAMDTGDPNMGALAAWFGCMLLWVRTSHE